MENETKKKNDKPFYNKWWFWVIVAFVLLGLIGSLGDDEDTTDTQIEATATATATAEPTEEPTEEPTAEPTEESTEAVEEEKIDPDVILTIMQSNFEGIGTIEYLEEEETFAITPTDSDFVTAILLVSNGDEESMESWDSMVDSICTMSLEIPGYIVSLLNPLNTENTLLIVYEGVVFYDFTSELE